ncbi:tRNA lysidine(34) synthetase TilS [Rhizobium sp. BK379]|uniref:tRNA lysidine(34) synthetase TilS n=1 Tax=Rhizobium sp. BK379 TaxID=2587059 RepID=UPI00160DA05E|nr:tRNA lysidine(34) synthetase TilS [Rhizobium sp. BK379]MBB3445950.1 tRNA(Ile)-lysidine synthase [Rhizobium sp. BK379]
MSPEAAIGRFLTSLKTPARILVAISGGSDSTGLLLLLFEALKATPNARISLCAATVDHALRSGSADEARDVAALCGSLGIPHNTVVWQGEKPKTGIMAAAREARYGLLAEAAEALGADLIVTGHTADDQRETLQMRGKRTEQLSTGIADAVLFDRRFWILRPLLFSSRADIRRFLSTRGVHWIDDPSNEDMKYERVQTRRQLSLNMVAETDVDTAAQRRLAYSSSGVKWLDSYFRLHGGLLGQVIPDGLRQDPAVFDYALGRLTAVFGGQPFVPGRVQMERLLAFAANGKPGRMTVGRVVFDLRRDGLYLARESRGILPLKLQPGETGVWDGRFFVRNGSTDVIHVDAAHAIDIDEGSSTRFPKAAWKRATASAPALSAHNVPLSAEIGRLVEVTPHFAPFDRFLTRFDFTFADRLSAVFSRAPYAEPPLRSIDGKTI